MPTINLIKDTKGPNDEPPRKKPQEDIAWTSPKTEKQRDVTKEPSPFAQPFDSFFASPKDEKQPKTASAPHPTHPEEPAQPLQPVQTPGPVPFRAKPPEAAVPEPTAPPSRPSPGTGEGAIEDIFAPGRTGGTASPQTPKEEPVNRFAPQPARPRILNEPKERRASLGRGVILNENVEQKPKRDDGKRLRNRDRETGQPEEGFSVNLLPEDLVVKFDPRRRLLQLLTVSGSVVALIALIVIGLSLFKTQIVRKTEQTQVEIAEVERQIAALRPVQEEAATTKKNIETIGKLLGEHVHWTKFFASLEQYTIPDVYYTGEFSGTTAGSLTLAAVGRSYEAVARQLLVFQDAVASKDFIQSVEINSVRLLDVNEASETPPGAVAFDVGLQLLPELFLYSSSDGFNERSGAGTSPSSVSPLSLDTAGDADFSPETP